MYLKVIFVQILALLYALTFSAQTLIINEVSQGESGNMEFIEFVVVDNSAVYDCDDSSPPTIDIRGWIIDDNNGYHSTANEGVAGGAVRFSNDLLWSTVPLGTIILVYNQGDISPSIPADDISLSDGNCQIVVPINNASLFESNSTTPGDIACSYPAGAWTPGGTWNNIILRNGGDCARILDLAGCEVFSVCWGDNSQNTQVYFGGSASNTVYYFNDIDPTNQVNWSSGCSDNETVLDATACGSNDQTPGSPNNTVNADYIAQFNNGCMPITPISTAAASTDASCGLCDGTATAISSGSIPGYTYSWFDASYNSIGQNTAVATALCPGTYHVISSSSINCSDTATILINEPGAPIAPIAGTDAIYCFGDALVDLTANGSGGLLTWYDDIGLTNVLGSGGVFSPSNTIGSTIYYVTETIAGCEGPPSLVTVTVTPLPTATLTGGGTICSGDPIPDMTVTLTGTAPWSVTYTDGVTPVTVTGIMTSPYTISGAADGSYVLSAVSDASCTGTFSGAAAIINIPLPLAPTAGVDATYCIGNPIVDLFAAGGGGGLTWYSDMGITIEGTGTAFSPINSVGVFTYYVSEEMNGCKGPLSLVNVTINALPTIDSQVAVDVSGCNITDGSITIVASGGLPPYSYSIDGGTTFTNTTGIFAGLDVNSYQVVVADANCQTVGSLLVITGPGIPSAPVAGSDATYCDGDVIVDLTAVIGSGGTMSWYADAALTNLVGSNVTFSPSNAVGTATYYVTETVTNCESASTQITITVNPTPLAPVTSGGNTYCEGDLIADLTATPAVGGVINWYDDAGLTNLVFTGQVYSPPSTVGASVYYAVESLNGCEGPPTSVMVTINELLTIDSEIEVNATGCGLSDGTITITASGGTGTYNFSIDGGSTFPNTTGVFTGLGVNSYQVVVTDGNCSVEGNLLTISAPSAPTAPAASTNSIYCDGDVVSDLTAIPGGGGSISWYDDAALTNLIGTGISYSPATAVGNYTYYITETVSGCESPSSQLTIEINPTPLAPNAFGDSTYCEGEVMVDLSVLPAVGGEINWYADNLLTNQVAVNTTTFTPPTAPGIYTYWITETLNGCEGDTTSAALEVVALPLSPLAGNDTSYCESQSIIDITATAQGAGTLAWYSDADLTNLIGTGSSLSAFATVGSIVYYIVEVNGNCIGTYDSIVINIDPAPVADFTATPTTGTSPLLVDFTDNSTGAGISYSWDFGNGITYFEQDTMNTYYNSGSFTSSLTVSDTNGCTDTYSLIITIENPPVPVDSSYIIVPNIFTPNADYENDFFKLNTNNILELEGTIFNRWGQVIFIINTIEGGWDGRTVAGIECPEGTYYYLIHALGDDGVEYNFQGPFELIR